MERIPRRALCVEPRSKTPDYKYLLAQFHGTGRTCNGGVVVERKVLIPRNFPVGNTVLTWRWDSHVSTSRILLFQYTWGFCRTPPKFLRRALTLGSHQPTGRPLKHLYHSRFQSRRTSPNQSLTHLREVLDIAAGWFLVLPSHVPHISRAGGGPTNRTAVIRVHLSLTQRAGAVHRRSVARDAVMVYGARMDRQVETLNLTLNLRPNLRMTETGTRVVENTVASMEGVRTAATHPSLTLTTAVSLKTHVKAVVASGAINVAPYICLPPDVKCSRSYTKRRQHILRFDQKKLMKLSSRQFICKATTLEEGIAKLHGKRILR